MDPEEEIEGKKLEIVKYAFGRFYEAGFHATSMEAALAGSGVSKRTLYKYFASKEDLIEAVLQLYASLVIGELFGPLSDVGDPRTQIIDFFDVSKIGGRMLTRGCLGMKAAQEYAGKNPRIVELGRNASLRGRAKFLELCEQAGFAEPERLSEQLNLIFQGALILSHTSGDVEPFKVAKETASAVLASASRAIPKKSASKR